MVEQAVDLAAQDKAQQDAADQLEREDEDEKFDLLLMVFERIVGGNPSFASTLLANSPDLYLFEDALSLFKERDRGRYRKLIVAFAVAKASLRVDRADSSLRDGSSHQVLHNLFATVLRELKVGDADAVAVLEEARRVFCSGYRTLNEVANSQPFDLFGAPPVRHVEALPTVTQSWFTYENLKTGVEVVTQLAAAATTLSRVYNSFKAKQPLAANGLGDVLKPTKVKGPAYLLKGGVAPTQH